MDTHRRLIGPIFSPDEAARVTKALAGEAANNSGYVVVELSVDDLKQLVDFVQAVRPVAREVPYPVARLILFDLREP